MICINSAGNHRLLYYWFPEQRSPGLLRSSDYQWPTLIKTVHRWTAVFLVCDKPFFPETRKLKKRNKQTGKTLLIIHNGPTHLLSFCWEKKRNVCATWLYKFAAAHKPGCCCVHETTLQTIVASYRREWRRTFCIRITIWKTAAIWLQIPELEIFNWNELTIKYTSHRKITTSLKEREWVIEFESMATEITEYLEYDFEDMEEWLQFDKID